MCFSRGSGSVKAGVRICSLSSALRCLSRVMADSSSPPELLLEKVTTHTWTRSLHDDITAESSQRDDVGVSP